MIERCRDKAVMKEWLRQHGGVRVNQARTVTDADGALDFQRRLGRWPIVVKPTAGSGSEDVYFPESDGELLAALGALLVQRLVGYVGTLDVLLGVVDALLEDEYAIGEVANSITGSIEPRTGLFPKRIGHKLLCSKARASDVPA